MEANLVRSLQARLPRILARWEELLRAELINTPLANPDMLVHLFDSTLTDIFNLLRRRQAPRQSVPASSLDALRAACECGRNPFLAYFLTGEQALLQTILQMETHKQHDTAVAELYLAVHQIARREIEIFCSLCQYRAVPTYHSDFCAANDYERKAVESAGSNLLATSDQRNRTGRSSWN